MSWRLLFMPALLSILCCAPVCAQSIEAVAPPTLGRLFLTPEKRLTLERQRQFNLRENDNIESDTLQLNGVVRRSSGHNSVWINQHMQPDGNNSVRLQASQPAEATITLDRNKPVKLQVGESVSRSTSERKDVVSPDAVRTGKRP